MTLICEMMRLQCVLSRLLLIIHYNVRSYQHQLLHVCLTQAHTFCPI